jgi:hypothetical protein
MANIISEASSYKRTACAKDVAQIKDLDSKGVSSNFSARLILLSSMKLVKRLTPHSKTTLNMLSYIGPSSPADAELAAPPAGPAAEAEPVEPEAARTGGAKAASTYKLP